MIKKESVQGGGAFGPLVYLVDDDGDFREEVITGLSLLGLEVEGFPDATALYRAYAARPANVVILDIGLDGEDGFSIATHLRASRSVGIVMATGRGSVDDRVKGLENGADAYLIKPIDIRELAATVSSISGRLGKDRFSSPTSKMRWALIEGGWILTDGLGARLRLTSSEKRILERLFLDRGKTVERRTLIEALEADIYEFNYPHLDTIVSRLRRRAEKSKMLIPLHTIRGLGFTFSE